MSVRLSELEEKFGFKIVERYPLELTAQGLKAAKRASEVKDAINRLVCEVEQSTVKLAPETPEPVQHNTTNDADILKVILAMQSTDEDGRLRMRLAATDALTLHKAIQRLNHID